MQTHHFLLMSTIVATPACPMNAPERPTAPPSEEREQPARSERSSFDDVLEEVENRAGEIARRVVVEGAELSDWGQEQLNRFLDELGSYRPMLQEAGYEMSSVRVRMGVVPAVTVLCDRLRRTSEEQQRELLKRYDDDKFKALFLRLLFRSDRIELAGYEARSVWVTISLSPHATVVLEPKG